MIYGGKEYNIEAMCHELAIAYATEEIKRFFREDNLSDIAGMAANASEAYLVMYECLSNTTPEMLKGSIDKARGL